MALTAITPPAESPAVRPCSRCPACAAVDPLVTLRVESATFLRCDACHWIWVIHNTEAPILISLLND